MATGTVTHTIKNGLGTALANVIVTAVPVPDAGVFGADNHEVVGIVQTQTDSSGTWSLALECSDGLFPPNTPWLITEKISQVVAANGGADRTYTVLVPPGTNTLGALVGLGAFSVAGLPGWQALYDADTLVAVNGALVANWPDGSGYGNAQVQGTGANQPRFLATGYQNGPVRAPSLHFGGSPVQMATAASFLTSSVDTSFAALLVEWGAVSGNVFFPLSNNSNNFYTGRDPANIWVSMGSSGSGAVGPNSNRLPYINFPANVLLLSYDGVNVTYNVNGMEYVTPYTAATTFAGTVLNLGAKANASYWPADVLKAGFNGVPPALATRQALVRYLQTRYGVYNGVTRVIGILGDSMTYGNGLVSAYTNATNNAWYAQLQTALGSTYRVHPYGNSGSTIATTVSGTSVQLATYRPTFSRVLATLPSFAAKKIAIVFPGGNDLAITATSGTAAQTAAPTIATALTTMVNALLTDGWTHVIVCTVMARKTSTAGNYTNGTTAAADYEAARLLLNIAIRALDNGTTIRVADLGFGSGGGATADQTHLADPTNTTYFEAAGLHPVLLGYTAVTNIVNTVVTAIG